MIIRPLTTGRNEWNYLTFVQLDIVSCSHVTHDPFETESDEDEASIVELPKSLKKTLRRYCKQCYVEHCPPCKKLDWNIVRKKMARNPGYNGSFALDMELASRDTTQEQETDESKPENESESEHLVPDHPDPDGKI